MKVLIVGDSPALATGFGTVNLQAVKALKAAGHEVAYVAGQEHKDDQRPQVPGTRKYLPESGDIMGFLSVPSAIEDFGADVVYHTGEAGTFTAFTKVVKSQTPLVGYIPIEGEPIIEHYWRQVLKDLSWFTCSQYGVDVTKRSINKDILYAYHGIDHEVFNVNGQRDVTRQKFGWEDKFVITCVAANVRRKQWPRLLEAISILKHDYKQKNIVLYAHTTPFDNYWLEGWNLPVLTQAFDIYEEVLFNPALNKHNAQVESNPDLPSLTDMYNASDLFVLPSQVEGFGLPIAEAMACGVPTLVTKYGAGWEVASPAGIGISVHDWDTHKSGTRYANVDPRQLAKQILNLKRSPNKLKRASELGLTRVQDFTWDHYGELLLDAIVSATPLTERP